jgi:hypothetical protein
MTLRRCPRHFYFTTRTALFDAFEQLGKALPRLDGPHRKRGTVDKIAYRTAPQAWLKKHQTTIWGSGVRISSGASLRNKTGRSGGVRHAMMMHEAARSTMRGPWSAKKM